MGKIEDIAADEGVPERETHNVTPEVFDQLAMLAECREFISAGLIGSSDDVFEVGGVEGMEPVEVSHPRWSEHISRWPDDAPKRHGFVVDSRCNVFEGPDVDPAHEFAHRVGDIYVSRQLAEALRAVDHPAIVAVKLRVQNVLEAVIDVREGNFPKAIAEDSDFAGDSGKLIMPSAHKKDVSNLTAMTTVRALDRKIPELLIPKCKLVLAGDTLVASWDVEIESKHGLVLSSFNDDISQEDGVLRNLWIQNVGKRLFQMRIGGRSEAFFHNLMIAAYSNRTIGACRYRRDEIFYFQKNAEGGLQVCLRVKLVDHRGPSGPGGGNRTDVEDGDFEFAMTG